MSFCTSLRPFASVSFASTQHHELLAAKSELSPSPTRQLSPDFTPKQLLRTLRLQNEETAALRIFEWASKQPNFIPICSVYEEILRKLGKVGSFESMRRVLEEMKLARPEIRRGTFLILVESYARFECYDEILGVVEMMEVEFGLKPDKHFYNFLLNVLVNGNELQMVGNVYSGMVRRGIKPDVSTFSVLIKGLCRAHEIKHAILLMEEMINNGLFPDKQIIRMLIKGCIEEGNLDGVLRIREQLSEARCPWSNVVVSILVDGLFKAGRIRESLYFIKKMSGEGFCPNQLTFHTLVNGLRKAGYVKHTLEFMGVRVQEGFDPGIFTSKSLVSGLKQEEDEEDMEILDKVVSRDCISTLCKENRIEEATKLARVLTSKGIVHDICTFNSLIRGLCLTGNHGVATEFFEEMKSKGCKPNVCTYNILIDNLCSRQRFEEALSLLKEMELNGCVRNVVTYNTLINGFCKNKLIEEAEVIFKQMELQGVSRNLVTYNTLIDGLCKIRRVKDASCLMDKMIKEGLKPNQLTYNSVLTFFCQTGNVKKAVDIIQTMTSNGCEPDIVTYNTLIGGLCKAGRVELEVAIRLLTSIQMKGMVLTPHAYNPVIQELFRRKRIIEALKLFREMIEKCDPPNDVTYNTVFRGLCNVGGPIGEAVDFAVEMMGKGFLPEFSSFFMLAERICALSMEKTLVDLVAMLMEKANLSDSEISMIKGFFRIHKFQDGLLTLGGILSSRDSKRANL